MNAIKKLILYPLCLLYVLTPGSKRLEDNGSHYYDALFLGVMNALILTAISYYFFDYSSRSYLHAVGSLGSWLGGWTFIGGIYYPILSEMLDKDKEKNKEAQRAKNLEASIKEHQRIAELNDAKEQYYDILKKDKYYAYDTILEADLLHRQGRDDEIKYDLLKDRDFMRQETRRFNITEITHQQNRIRRVTAERKAQAEREQANR